MLTLTNPPPVPYPARYIIDPVAFCLALIGGPLLFTGLTFWLFVPIFALALGGPVYLAVGTPVLIWYLGRNDGAPGDLALLAFLVMAALLILFPPAAIAIGRKDLLNDIFVLAAFGLIFAPAWAYFFGLLYQKYRRDFFAKPRPF